MAKTQRQDIPLDGEEEPKEEGKTGEAAESGNDSALTGEDGGGSPPGPEGGKETTSPGPEDGKEKPEAAGGVLVVSPERAGRTIFAATGTAIAFDGAGKAVVSAEDAFYLQKCPGFMVGP
ncbi:MAG: hypothetical protein LBT33_08170 [Spirochaetia bacterium]|jgi:hypothetical protein|nr:hypothetical protein [Spirochaetia bacterium]